jgi:hypothetical protein
LGGGAIFGAEEGVGHRVNCTGSETGNWGLKWEVGGRALE